MLIVSSMFLARLVDALLISPCNLSFRNTVQKTLVFKLDWVSRYHWDRRLNSRSALTTLVK